MRHKDRIEPFRRYCVGLLILGERKSVEPMAARLNPARAAAEHQSLLHFVGQSPWNADRLLQAVRAEVLPVMTQDAPVASWIIDDTGFPKQGPHSVGDARQYCGEAPLQPGEARRLPFPKVDQDGTPPLRPERHAPTSIATLKMALAYGLAQLLPRCPCYYRPREGIAEKAAGFVTQ